MPIRTSIRNRKARSPLALSLGIFALAAALSVAAHATSNIYIAASQADATAAGMVGTDTSANSSGPANFQASGAIQDSLLLVSTLQTALASSDVTVTTANSSGVGPGKIIVVDPLTWASTHALNFNAASCVQADESISASANAAINFNVGPALAAVVCGDPVYSGIYVVGAYLKTGKSVTSNGGNLGFFSNGSGFSGNGLSILFDTDSSISTTGAGTIHIQTDAAAANSHLISNGVVAVVDGGISADIGGGITINGASSMTASEIKATGTSTVPLASGGQIDLRSRSGNIYMLAATVAARIATTAGAIRLNAANAVLLQGGSGDVADASILPIGDLQIDATALYAIAGTGLQSDATVTNTGANADTLVTLTGNPIGLIQPSSYSLYLAAGNSDTASSESAALQQNNSTYARNVVIRVDQGDVVLQGGSSAGAFCFAEMQLHGQVSDSLTLSNGNLKLLGGSGVFSGASISSAGVQLDLTINGSALLQASSVGDGSAYIGTDPGLNLQVLGPNGNLSLIGGTGSSVGCCGTAGISTQNGDTSVQQIRVDQTLLLQGGTLSGYNATINGPTQIITAGNLIMQDGPGGTTAITNAGGNQDYPQTITALGNLSLGLASGAGSNIYHGGPTPQKIVVGKSLLVNATGTISTSASQHAPTILVVDNQNPARVQHDSSHTLLNNGTLTLDATTQIFSVSPASTTLGSFVPPAVAYNHWYGEAGSVNGINYKSFADGSFAAAPAALAIPALSPALLLLLGMLFCAGFALRMRSA